MRSTPRSAKEAEDFLGEQRVALGLVRHMRAPRPRAERRRPSRVSDQALHVARRQRLQPKRRRNWAFAPGRLVFRSPRMEDQQAELGLAVDDLAQQFLRDAVDPMQVLDQQTRPGEAAARCQQALQAGRACAGRSARRRGRRATLPAV